MPEEPNVKLKYLKLFTVFFIVQYGIVFAFLTLSFQYEKENEKTGIAVAEIHHLELYANGIMADLKSLAYTLVYLQNQVTIHEPFTNPEERAAFSEDLLSFVETNPLYDQIRIIKHDGQEIIRIDHVDGAVHFASEDQLQNKRKRYYFQKTIRLAAESLYISSIDFNVEHGEIEKPLKPILRIALPVFEGDQKMGIAVFNILSNLLFKSLPLLAPIDGSSSMLVDSKGKVLVSTDPAIAVITTPVSQVFSNITHASLADFANSGKGYAWEGDSFFSYLAMSLQGGLQQIPHIKHVSGADNQWLLLTSVPEEVAQHQWEAEEKTYAFYVIFFLMLSVCTSILLAIYRIQRDEQTLVASERKERIANLLLSMPATMYTGFYDGGEYKLAFISDHMKAGLNIAVEEVIDQPDWLMQHLHPDDRDRIKAAYEALQEGDHIQLIYRLQNGHGDFVWVQDVLTCAVDSSSHTKIIKGVWTDVTRLKAHQAEMEKLTQALDAAGDGVVITDPVGTIECVNQAFCETTGYAKDEVIGNNPSMLQSGKQDSNFYRELWSKLKHQGEWEGILWNKRKNGEIYPERLHIKAVINEQRQLCNYIGTFSDITKELSVEQQVRQATKMEAIGTLVGGVAHNFNNLLAGITGHLFLAQRANASEEIARRLAAIDSIIGRAAGIVSQLLIYIHEGLDRKEWFELVPLLNEGYKTAALGLTEDIKVDVDFGEEDYDLYGVASDIQQILLNLVSNARDALIKTPDKKLSIALSPVQLNDEMLVQQPELRGKTVVCLSVRDNGAGIAAADMAKIFDPFFTTKEVGKGTGLGLSMTFGSVQDHGGFIEVSSNAREGTCFNIYLPVRQSSPVAQATAAEDAVYATNSPRLLIVDDDIGLLNVTGEAFTALGYAVLKAENGVQALALYEEHKVDLAAVISDVVMPELDGVGLSAAIRKDNPDLPIVLISGYDDRALNLSDMDKYNILLLSKPVKISVLSKIVDDIIQSKTQSNGV